MKKRLIIALFGSGAAAADEIGSIAADLGAFAEIAMATDPAEIVGFDAVLVPMIDGETDVDVASFEIPAIGLNIRRTKHSDVTFGSEQPLINVVDINEDARCDYALLKATLMSLDMITSKRREGGSLPTMASIILIEDDQAIVRATTRLLRGGDPSIQVQAFSTVAAARAGITCNPAVVIIDGDVGGGYAELDGLTRELLALNGRPLIVFRSSGRADLIREPAFGLLWKPSRTGELQHRVQAVLDWLKKPLS